MRRSQSGVTLIEMMIGIVIVGILTAMAAPSFQDWINNSRVRTAAESIKNGLQLARSESVRRNLSVRWQLTAANGGDWRVLERDSGLDIQSRSGSEGSSSAVANASQTTIDFDGFGRVTPTPALPVSIDVGSSLGTCVAGGGEVRCLRVLVGTAGQIRMCDPKLGTGVAGAC